jgi:hypothetical protein
LRCRSRPIVDQVGGVHGTYAGSEIPADGRAVGRSKRSSGSREHTHRTVAEETVGTYAVHIHITQSDVVENAVAGDGVSVARIAGTVAA